MHLRHPWGAPIFTCSCLERVWRGMMPAMPAGETHERWVAPGDVRPRPGARKQRNAEDHPAGV